MEELTRTQVLDRIKALELRTDLSRGNTEAEALAAAQMMASMIFNHNISPEELRRHTRKDRNTVEFVQVEFDLMHNSRWRRDLLAQICGSLFCKHIILTSKHNLHKAAIVGQPENIEVVIYLYEYLRKEFERLAAEEFAKAQPKRTKGAFSDEKLKKLLEQLSSNGVDIDVGELLRKRSNSNAHAYAEVVHNGKSWKNSFYGAAVSAVGARLREQRRTDEKHAAELLHEEQPEVDSDDEVRSLIVLRDDELGKAYNKFFPQVKTIKSRSTGRFVGGGWNAGYKAGQSVSLNKGLKGQHAPEMIEAGV